MEIRQISPQDLNLYLYDAAALRVAGYSANELKLVGFDAFELREGSIVYNFTISIESIYFMIAHVCLIGGFNAVELRCAGFCPSDLRDCGFNCSQVHAAGFSIRR